METVIRYTKQRRAADCVTTAFINILKWSGQKFSYNYANKAFSDLLECDENGTSPEKELAMMRVLNLAGFPIEVFPRQLNLADIDRVIKSGRILAATSFLANFTVLHTYLIVGTKFKEIQVVNAVAGKAMQSISRKALKYAFLQRMDCYPNAFAIGKPN